MWSASMVECRACGYRWGAVAEDFTPELMECSACGQLSGEVVTKEELVDWKGRMFAG